MAASTEESLVSGYTGRILLALSLGTVGLLAGQLTIAPLLPVIIDEFAITASYAGGAMTVMWASAALAMYPGGRLSDVLTRPSVLVVALSIAAFGLFIAVISPAFSVFVIGLAVLGIGIGLYEPPGMAFISDLFVEARGRAYGIISASYNVGSGAAAGLATAAVLIGTWRFAFLPTIVLLGIVVLLLHWWRAEPYEFNLTSFQPWTAFRRVTDTRRVQLLVLLFCLQMFIWQGSASFYPTLVRTDLNFSPTVANIAFASIFVTGLIVTPLAGSLGDRFGHLRIAVFVPVFGAAGLTMILLVPSLPGLMVGTFLYAIGLMAFWPLITTEFVNVLSASTIGADYGVTRALFYGLGSLGPTYVGVVTDEFSIVLAYFGLVGCFLAAAGIVISLSRFPP